MSILKNHLRTAGSSVRSGERSTNSKIINRVCATFLAGLILFIAGGTKAQNVLINPGAETGDLTGWNVSDTGYIFVVSINSLVPGTTIEHYLAHSGSNTFELFDTTANSAYMWQDYAAQAGSQWSASCWAICYASNYFDSAFAYMSVAFYDTNNNVLGLYSDPGFGTYGYGVYAGAVLDPRLGNSFPPYIIVPPPAVDASGWLYLPATNFWYSYMPANTNNAPGTNIETVANVPLAVSSTLVAPPGTAFVRYQLEYDNQATDGGAVYWDDCVLEKLTQSDPDIVNPQPVSQTIYAGDGASFTVNAVAQGRGETLTYQWQENGTNLPVHGGTDDIYGDTTNITLYFTNCVVTDSGSYACWVSDRNGSIRTVPVTLTVLIPPCPPRGPNKLGNPGFESAPVWAPWGHSNGAYFVCATNTYDDTTTPVNIYDGNWSAMIGANGDSDNGVYQIVTGVTPGTIWKAGAYAYISSFNDFAGYNTERIQIWFRDSNGTPVPGTSTYESFKIYGLAYTNADMQYTNIDTSSPYYGQVMYHDQLVRDQWCCLPVTNVVNNGGIGLGDDLPYTTLTNGLIMVPTNANIAQINFQIYEFCPVAGNNLGYTGVASDAVYWDDCYLIQILPVTNLTTSVSGSNVNLSFWINPGLSYEIHYKTNLTDATWRLLTYINTFTNFFDGKTVTVSDPITAQNRFYRVEVR